MAELLREAEEVYGVDMGLTCTLPAPAVLMFVLDPLVSRT